MSVYSVILAAGEGKRMKSKLAKPLHKICGKTMVDWVLDAAEKAGSKENLVVVGHKAEDVKSYLGQRCGFALQATQQGTGHAVMQAESFLKDKHGVVMVLNGDAPLIKSETLKQTLDKHMKTNSAATIVTADFGRYTDFGRIVRNNGTIQKIVEVKDADENEKKITEVNAGIYFFDIQKLLKALSKLSNNNAQGEYYLTDTIEILLNDGETVESYMAESDETFGVNDRAQLAFALAIMNKRIVESHMLNGVTVVNPDNVYIDANVEIGMDTVIYPNSILEGDTKIGEDNIIGPNSKIVNTKIGDGCEVINSVLTDSSVGCDTHIGPFAYLRPGSQIGDHVKVGDFVEIKNAKIGNNTKISHLTYVGDAEVGERVNFGCGTVVVNYDGFNKYKTIIEDDAFIGCNTNLVSPVHVKKGAFTAAGSTITDDVPEYSLAIARSRQTVKENWTKSRGDKPEK